MVADCPGCGLHFEREPGYWTGAVAVNLALVAGTLVLVLALVLALTVPAVPVVPILVGLVPVAMLGPALAYPVSKTLWVALDRSLLQRLDRRERPDEQYRI